MALTVGVSHTQTPDSVSGATVVHHCMIFDTILVDKCSSYNVSILVVTEPRRLRLKTELKSKRRSLTPGALVVSTCSPPLVDEDWHSFCQGPFEGIEAVDWSEVFATIKKVGGKGGKVSCGSTGHSVVGMSPRKDGGDSYYDPSNKYWLFTRAQSKQNARKDCEVSLEEVVRRCRGRCQDEPSIIRIRGGDHAVRA